MDMKVFLGNQESLRDFMHYFPVSELSNWQPRWTISMDNSYIFVEACAENPEQNTLTMVFEGDGVVIFKGIHDGIEFRDFYDDHCLDNGKKFKKLLEKYAPFKIFLH